MIKILFSSFQGDTVADLMLRHARHHECKDVEGFRRELGAIVNEARANTIKLGKVCQWFWFIFCKVSCVLWKVFEYQNGVPGLEKSKNFIIFAPKSWKGPGILVPNVILVFQDFLKDIIGLVNQLTGSWFFKLLFHCIRTVMHQARTSVGRQSLLIMIFSLLLQWGKWPIISKSKT